MSENPLEMLGLRSAKGTPSEERPVRPRWRWAFWAMAIVALYAITMAVLVSYVVAFQYLRDMGGWVGLARLWLGPFFDVADLTSGLVRAAVAVATRDEIFAATVSMAPTFIRSLAVGLAQGALIVGIASLFEVLVSKLRGR